jgi:DNA-binding PadR family transcriptional regulator
MKDLTSNETAILVAILSLEKEAYGVAIKDYLSKFIHKKVSFGTLYSYLDQLFRKGLLTKALGNPVAERGGRAKIYYRLTEDGRTALKSAFEHQKRIAKRLSEVLADKA